MQKCAEKCQKIGKFEGRKQGLQTGFFFDLCAYLADKLDLFVTLTL